MNYLIGNVAKLFGMSIEGIRNYEKYDIVFPQRKPDSQYRTFSYLDITSLIRSKMYKAMGFSMKEIGYLTNDADVGDIIPLLQNRKAALASEYEYIHGQIECIDDMIFRIATMRERLNTVRICEKPAIYRFEFSKNGVVYHDSETVRLFQEWISFAPFSFMSSRYYNGDVYGGIAIHAKYATLLGLKETSLVQYHPACICLQTVVEEENNEYSDNKCLEQLKQFADHHNFELDGQMYGYTMLGLHKKTSYQRYREIFAEIFC